MASTDFDSADLCRQRYRCDLRQARLYFGVAYPFCLAFSVARRLIPQTGDAWSGKIHRQSVFREARAAAASIVPFAFR